MGFLFAVVVIVVVVVVVVVLDCLSDIFSVRLSVCLSFAFI